METSIRAIVRKISAAALMATFAAGVILCAPATTTTSTSNTSTSTSTPASVTRAQSSKMAAVASTTTTESAAPINGVRQLSSLATELRSMPSLAGVRDAKVGPQSAAMDGADQLSTFDGRNPFADDSLWHIPIHLVRDAGASEPPTSGRDSMAKSASELSSAANLDDNDEDGDVLDDDSTASLLEHQKELQQQQQPQPSGASNSPTVISASTDLKTAAGYNHASPQQYAGDHAHHDAGQHYGAGHQGGDHYGKYFQYASVPYPYAWDFGYRRGNPYHTIERYEHGKGPHFQTKVKWSDKYGGHGVHVWDYNHDDHHSHHYGSGGHGHGDDHYAPAHYGGGHHASAHGSHHYGGGGGGGHH